MSASQAPTCHFLRIPRELRDQIYELCLTSDEGYHHHAETNTLRYHDGTAINLGLLYSCKQVAAEAAELTLSTNTITFKTHIARVAGVGGFLGHSLISMETYLRRFLSELNESMQEAAVTALDIYATEGLARHISKRYPQSCIGAQLQLMVQMKEQYRDLPDTTVLKLEPTHMDRQALQEALEYISSHHGLSNWLTSWRVFGWPRSFWNWINNIRYEERHGPRPERRSALEIANSTVSSTVWLPWTTPTTAQIKQMRQHLAFLKLNRGVLWLYSQGGSDEGEGLRYYESAASQSIRFLDILQQKQRSGLRRLVIREDRRSCASPRCHAHGLIPYLRDLPRLRIDHHVDMWSVIFLDLYALMSWIFSITLRTERPTCGLSRAAYKTIDWINEAMDLRHAGMPSSAYSLHLEADFVTAQRVWNAIKSLAALALANQRRHHKIQDPPNISTGAAPSDYELDFIGCQERRLVTSVRLILSGDPTVQLSCPTGTLEEFEEDAHRVGNALKDQPRDAWKLHARSLVQGNLDTLDYDFAALEELYYDPNL